jgi:hypothetical protein
MQRILGCSPYSAVSHNYKHAKCISECSMSCAHARTHIQTHTYTYRHSTHAHKQHTHINTHTHIYTQIQHARSHTQQHTRTACTHTHTHHTCCRDLSCSTNTWEKVSVPFVSCSLVHELRTPASCFLMSWMRWHLGEARTAIKQLKGVCCPLVCMSFRVCVCVCVCVREGVCAWVCVCAMPLSDLLPCVVYNELWLLFGVA